MEAGEKKKKKGKLLYSLGAPWFRFLHGTRQPRQYCIDWAVLLHTHSALAALLNCSILSLCLLSKVVQVKCLSLSLSKSAHARWLSFCGARLFWSSAKVIIGTESKPLVCHLFFPYLNSSVESSHWKSGDPEGIYEARGSQKLWWKKNEER